MLARQRAEVEFDRFAVGQRAIPLTFDDREVDKDAARGLWCFGDSPALLIVQPSDDGARHPRIVGSGIRTDEWASVLLPVQLPRCLEG